MYVPSSFAVSDPQAIALIRSYPLGALVTCSASGLDANHVPFELEQTTDGRTVLRAHVARSNPVWQEARDGDDVLVIFRAADAYISPNWYPSKHELHEQVPTWNYMVVNAHGTIRIHDDERYVRGVVARLTRAHEAGQPTPWKMTDSAPEFIDARLRAIVGIEVEVSRLVGKCKLSQNREARDRDAAARALKAQGVSSLGDAMLQAGRQEDLAP